MWFNFILMSISFPVSKICTNHSIKIHFKLGETLRRCNTINTAFYLALMKNILKEYFSSSFLPLLRGVSLTTPSCAFPGIAVFFFSCVSSSWKSGARACVRPGLALSLYPERDAWSAAPQTPTAPVRWHLRQQKSVTRTAASPPLLCLSRSSLELSE